LVCAQRRRQPAVIRVPRDLAALERPSEEGRPREIGLKCLRGKIDANSIIDAEKWQMAKERPRVYGDRIAAEITGKDGGPIEVEGEALELARRVAYLLRAGAEQQDNEILLISDT
jgi:hypothetical protein